MSKRKKTKRLVRRCGICGKQSKSGLCAKCGEYFDQSFTVDEEPLTFTTNEKGTLTSPKETKETESVLTEAERIINGDRRNAYGPVEESFAKIANGWSCIANAPITPRQVALMMCWLKICRDNNKPARDNAVDIAGYAGLMEKL